MSAIMKIRLIKPGSSSAKQNKTEELPDKPEEGPEEVQMIDTIRSWVTDFKSRKASGTRLDFLRVSSAGKT